jgi:hypothetical protein
MKQRKIGQLLENSTIYSYIYPRLYRNMEPKFRLPRTSKHLSDVSLYSKQRVDIQMETQRRARPTISVFQSPLRLPLQ